MPLTDLGFDMISRGELPLWNPYINCGMPLASSIEIGLFYPPHWIHLLCPSSQAFNLLVLFHMGLAFTGAFLYGRNRAMSVPGALIPAMVYGFSGPMILHLWAGHMSIVASLAWLPLIFFCTDKCFEQRTVLRMLALIATLSCQFLAGFPIFTLGLALILIPYVFVFGFEFGKRWRSERNLKLLLMLTASAVLSFALIAIQFFPTLEFLNNSHRGVLSYEIATTHSFPLQNLITFIIPDFYGNLIQTMYWGPVFI